MSHPELSEPERFPLLTPAGRRRLRAMREDVHAPRWNWPNGEQLDAAGLEVVRAFAARLDAERPAVPPARPDWLSAFVDHCLAEVPFHRARCRPGTPFGSIPTCTRDDLAAAPWAFVPDGTPLDRLIVFSSSGTTGHPAALPTHPATAACGVPLLEAALAPLGVRLPRGVDRTALLHVAAYPGAYTTAIVVAHLAEAGCVRVNLDAADWREPGDPRAYLARWPAPVVLGDPIAFDALRAVELPGPPAALVSSILALGDAAAASFSSSFGAPIVDVYAMTEAGIVAARRPGEPGHVILPPDLHVEILDDDDQPCPPGMRGEVVLTGGRNPFGPLLRYRTGDFAALGTRDGRPVLLDLEGRPPVVFPVRGGRVVHSMEITRRLRPFPLLEYRLHQDADGGFLFGYRGEVDRGGLRDALFDLLGRPDRLDLAPLPPPAPGRRKVLQYRSDRIAPLPRRPD